jgi:hypothetical protein
MYVTSSKSPGVFYLIGGPPLLSQRHPDMTGAIQVRACRSPGCARARNELLAGVGLVVCCVPCLAAHEDQNFPFEHSRDCNSAYASLLWGAVRPSPKQPELPRGPTSTASPAATFSASTSEAGLVPFHASNTVTSTRVHCILDP